MWKEFGEAVEKDFLLTSRRFRQTDNLRRVVGRTVYCLLPFTENIVGQCRDTFEELLNLTIYFAKVTKVVKQLHSGNAPEVDEVHCEIHLDIVGLSWVTHLFLFNATWRLKTILRAVFCPLIRRVNYISHLAWEHLGIHQHDLQDEAR